MSARSLTSRAILGRLFMALEQGPIAWADQLSMYVPSDQPDGEEHRWLGMSPMMREWVGGRHVHGLRDYGIFIKNLDYEATLGVSLDEVEFDKTAQVQQRIDDLAARAAAHGNKLLSDLLIAAEATVCYDGQYFFDTDHAEGESGSQSNDIAFDISDAATGGTPTAPTVSTMVQAILKGIQQLYGLKDDRGEPLNETASQFMAMVPIGLWAPGMSAVTVSNLAGGETNVIANAPDFKVKVQPNPRLTWTDKFSVFRTDPAGSARPFIRQEARPLRIKSQAEGSAEEFNNNRWLFGIDKKGGYGYGFWQHACLVTLQA